MRAPGSPSAAADSPAGAPAGRRRLLVVAILAGTAAAAIPAWAAIPTSWTQVWWLGAAFAAIGATVALVVERLGRRRRETGDARARDAAARARRDLLALVNREIRTALNGITGAAALIDPARLDEAQREGFEAIRASGDALLAAVEDALALAAGTVDPAEDGERSYDLIECVEQVIAALTPRAAARDLALVHLIGPQVPHRVAGDAARLRHVLATLAGHALGRTTHGQVTVQVEGAPDGDHAEIVFRIADTGPAPTRAETRALGADAGSPADAGALLDLAVCRRLVELMSGGISIAAGARGGAVCEFSMAVVPLGGDGRPPGSRDWRGEPVLLVGHHEITGRYLHLFLRSRGLLPTVAAGAAQARASLETGRWRAVIVAAGAPEDLSPAALRARLPDLPLVVTGARSADARPGGRAVALTAPVRQASLLAALAQAVDGAPAEVPVPDTRDPRDIRLLVAEDNPINRKVTRLMLERLGYRPDLASDGREALARVEAQSYDIVLMDVSMPVMTGIEAALAIRRSLPAEAQPRIIAMTANTLDDNAAACLDAGMDAVLSKPAAFTALRDVLRRHAPARQAA